MWIIDVSQSVDLDHPKALDFLREDCKHINHFFRTKGILCFVERFESLSWRPLSARLCSRLFISFQLAGPFFMCAST